MNRREWLKTGLTAAAPLLGSAAAAAAEREIDGKPALTLWQLPSQSTSQMESYILLTDSDQLVVIDGGMKHDADYLLKKIREIHPDGRVDYWLFTHIHLDHAHALATIVNRYPDALRIGQVYCDFPTPEWIARFEAGSHDVSVEILEAFAKLENVTKMPKGEPLRLGSVEITALNDLDDLDMERPGMTINDTSILYRVKTPETTILFLGDLEPRGQEALVGKLPAEAFKADVVQMAHHGQNGVTREFYDLVRPTACLWCAPEWLWDNNPPGQGSDTGPWKTVQTRAWMNEMGVRKHYVIKDGLIKLEFA
ncbi:MAG: MBL fold metallo-hydrolase [Thermoguttaceae bacterium]|nr:MBL fold metallo-hydrolase [Thermoguttaceae bacterium]